MEKEDRIVATKGPYIDVGYCRISKDRVGAGLGVQRQQFDINEMRSRRGLGPIERWYVDNDISASDRRKNRPDYQRLLADIQRGVVALGATLWLWHTDRLHRRIAELEHYIDVTLPFDIKVESVRATPLDLNTAAGRMLARQMGVQAQYYAEHMSEQLCAQKAERARNGLKVGGGRPFGYTTDGMELVGWEVELIRWAVKHILHGGSLRSVTAKWNEAGARRARSGKEWNPNYVRAFLAYPRIAGLAVYKGKVVGKAAWPAIISEEEHQAIKTLLADSSRLTHAGIQPRHLGSGLYRCGAEPCGQGLIGARANGLRAYRCRPRSPVERGARGSHVGRLADPLDELISDLLVERMEDPEFLSMLRPDDEGATDAARLHAELSVIDAEQMQLAGMLSKGWSVAMVTEANRALAERKSAIESRLAAILAVSPATQMAAQPSVARAWADAPLCNKRDVLRELAIVTVLPAPKGRRAFDPDYIKVAWRGVSSAPEVDRVSD